MITKRSCSRPGNDRSERSLRKPMIEEAEQQVGSMLEELKARLYPEMAPI